MTTIGLPSNTCLARLALALRPHMAFYVSFFLSWRKCVRKSIGSGKIIVEFFSAEIEFRV